MFQYASLYGIAVRNGMTLVVRDDAELYDVFDYLYANKIKNDSFCDEAEYMEESEPCLYDEDAANIDSSQNISMILFSSHGDIFLTLRMTSENNLDSERILKYCVKR